MWQGWYVCSDACEFWYWQGELARGMGSEVTCGPFFLWGFLLDLSVKLETSCDNYVALHTTIHRHLHVTMLFYCSLLLLLLFFILSVFLFFYPLLSICYTNFFFFSLIISLLDHVFLFPLIHYCFSFSLYKFFYYISIHFN